MNYLRKQIERLSAWFFILRNKKKLAWDEPLPYCYRPVIFCDCGIGNVVCMHELIKTFSDPVLVTKSETIKNLMEYIYPFAVVCDYDNIPENDGVVICNFLNQRKWQIRYILRHGFTYRIAHSGGKFERLFNKIVKYENIDEVVLNKNLVK